MFGNLGLDCQIRLDTFFQIYSLQIFSLTAFRLKSLQSTQNDAIYFEILGLQRRWWRLQRLRRRQWRGGSGGGDDDDADPVPFLINSDKRR